MMSNNTTGTPAPRGTEYTCVRFYVSTVSFSVLLVFNLLINWTIVREERLRTRARFVLLLHLLLSALLHLGTSSLFYYQVHRGARPGRVTCGLVVTVLISSASNILLTLTAMAVDRYCAVCHPLRYAAACARGRWPWLVGGVTWLLALLIPLTLLLGPDPRGAEGRGDCGPEQLRRGGLQKVLFIGGCTVLIIYSYARILVEGRRMGLLNRRNRAGCRTIALHASQLAVYILPNFVSFVLSTLHRHRLICAHTKELSAVVTFAFFSLAQCVAPVVYGLRKEELLEQLSRRFPFWHPKTVLGWTVGATQHHPHFRARERTLTVQTFLSLDVPQVPTGEKETRPETDKSSSQNTHSCQGDANDA